MTLLKKKAIKSINSLSRDYKEIINSKKIIINGKTCKSLLSTIDGFVSGKSSFSKMINNNFDQKSKTIIHGDLTFENILIKDNNFYFIDPYGGFLDYKSNKNILILRLKSCALDRINFSFNDFSQSAACIPTRLRECSLTLLEKLQYLYSFF